MSLKPDLIYEVARNSLLAEAERIADKHIENLGLRKDDSIPYREEWSRTFSRTMDALWLERGQKLMEEFRSHHGL